MIKLYSLDLTIVQLNNFGSLVSVKVKVFCIANRQMPQHYKRKTYRATRIPADVLQRAADEVQQGTSISKVAASFNIDKMTLSRYIAK